MGDLQMMDEHTLFDKFLIWGKSVVTVSGAQVEVGKADPDLEDIAWIRIVAEKSISGIKLWNSGDYYLEVLSMRNEEPELARSGSLDMASNFDTSFSDFVEKIIELEGPK